MHNVLVALVCNMTTNTRLLRAIVKFDVELAAQWPWEVRSSGQWMVLDDGDDALQFVADAYFQLDVLSPGYHVVSDQITGLRSH